MKRFGLNIAGLGLEWPKVEEMTPGVLGDADLDSYFFSLR